MYLSLDRVSKTFAGRGEIGEVLAVDEVSLDIAQGEIVSLLGPSGCGKTTTLRMIAGFEFPTAGELLLDGELLNPLPPHRRDMSMVFQSYAIFPHLNVFENVAYGLRVQRRPQAEVNERVERVLDLVELPGFGPRAPNQLSGGQQQRVALARALVMEPKVLLMDEPLSNLDAKLREQMRSEIRRIQKLLGITSVYVTHDQAEAMTISDRIVVMRDGRIEQVGSPVEIYRHPANRFVANFLGRANFVPGTLLAQRPDTLDVEVWGRPLTVPSWPGADFQAGQPVTVVVRPEMIELRETEAHLRGIVRQAAYLGSQIEYVVEANGQLLAVVENDPLRYELHPEGAPIGLRLIEPALSLLREPPPGPS